MLETISSLLGYLMNFIYNVVQNYGIAIILFTLLVKLLLLPLAIKQQKSLEATQELQPIVQELQRKYGNDQQKFTEEYQKVLKERNMSMTSRYGMFRLFTKFNTNSNSFGNVLYDGKSA